VFAGVGGNGSSAPTSNSSYNTGRFMSEASFISLLRI
jgi:hypothetical protein